MLKGLENLKIDGVGYKYQNTDLSVNFVKKEQKLDLRLGPKFNSKKAHLLFISLNSQSSFSIILNFDLLWSHLAYLAKHSEYNDTYEIDVVGALHTGYTGYTFDVFDAFTDEQVNSTAIYQSDKNVLELSNIAIEMPYVLKISGREITRLYLMTNMSLEEKTHNYDKTFFIGAEKGPRVISLFDSEIHRFLSFLIVKGKQDLKIEDYNNKSNTTNVNSVADKLYKQYLNYTQNIGIELKEDTVTKERFRAFWNSITEEAWQKIASINKNEKSLGLNLGSLFDYTKEYKLTISLQDDITSTINVNFNVSDLNCHLNLTNPVQIVETNVKTIEFEKFGK